MPLQHTRSSRHAAQAGFTLIELMIYVSLTAVIVGLFGGILIVTTRIQGEQNSSVQVTQELNFLMNSIKRYVHDSTSYVISSPTQLVTETNDGVNRLSQTINYDSILKEVDLTEDDGVGAPVVSRLSSNKIHIDGLTFTDIRQGSSTAVHINIVATASTTNPVNAITRTLESTASSLVQEQ